MRACPRSPLPSTQRTTEMCDTRPMSARDPSRSRALRRDAVENPEKLLRPAAELMVQRGDNVPLSEIAEAAGVGVGTLYRGFADREALLAALQRRGYDLCLTILEQIRANGLTGAGAIEAYLIRCHDASDELVAMPLRGVDPLPDAEAVAAKRRIVAMIQEFLAEGQADGSVHPDVAAIDVVVFSTIMATPLPHGPDWPTTSRHLI